MTKNITFSGAIDLIDADIELPLKKRRDLKSSINTFLRATNKPATLPFSAPVVRAGMNFINANRGELKKSRLYNIRNHLKTVLARYDAPTRAPMRSDLMPEWSKLRGLIDDDVRLGRNLSRFMHWVSARKLMPREVTDEVMEEYLNDLELRTFLEKPTDRFRDTCKAWNQARDEFPDWPDIELTLPSYRKQISPAWDAFPASFIADLDAYERRMTGSALCEEDAPAPRRKVTIDAHREHFRRLAGALVRSGTSLDSITTLATLVEPDNIKASLKAYEEWLGRDLRNCPSIYEMMAAIRVMARYYVKARPDTLRVIDLDLPPLNWSTFELRNPREDRYGEEKLQAGRDCREAATG
ncbi:MAG: hypothetical protein RIC16_13000 [Rhodospirillales bacterium]